MKAETAVIAFDLEGSGGVLGRRLFVGQGRALARPGGHGRGRRSWRRGAIRVSLGYATSEEELGRFLKAWDKLAESLYKAGNQQEIAA